MTKYQYDGIMSNTETGWTRTLIQQYPHVVEAKNEIKVQVLAWIKANVESVQGVGEGCMGEPYIKTYQPWAMFGRNVTTMFFLSKAEYANGLKDTFGDSVTINPFRTEF